MPRFQISPDAELHYLVDDFTDPWSEPDTILLLHGNSESSASWYGWVPHLARRYRVVRPDMRGFGASTPMPRDFPWTLDIVIDDFIRLMDFLKVDRFHLVAAKVGGIIARAFAARRAYRVRTLTVAGSPPPVRTDRNTSAQRASEVEEIGSESRARNSMQGRFGSRFPRAGLEWWAKYMGQTAVSTEVGFVRTINFSDITADIPNIKCPTLVITTEASSMASVEQTQAWQCLIPRSELMILPGDSAHVAASDPDACAKATLEFLGRRGSVR